MGSFVASTTNMVGVLLVLFCLSTPYMAKAVCPCDSLGTYCQYAPPDSPCPRKGVCHGYPNSTCSCDSCPNPDSSCKGCSPSPGPTPGPSPGPAPGPTPGPSPTPSPPGPCPDGYVQCNCYCDAGDTIYGSFGCNCENYKPLPASQQTKCCGGEYGFDAWCAKAGTQSAKNAKCSNQTTSGSPTPPEDFYQFGTYRRCVKDRCNAYFCDNPKPDYPTGCQG